MLETMMRLVGRDDPGKPANFAENNYIYIPSLPTAIVALVIWCFILAAIIYRSYRYKVWYFTVMMVGLVMEVIGYIMRVYGHFHLSAHNPYVTMQALVILAPVMFAAANYVIFGRLLHYGHLIYPNKRLTWLPTKHVVAVFVSSDVISFIIQIGGAILLLNDNTNDGQQSKARQAGQNTLMAGLSVNLASFCLFFTLIIWFEVVTHRIAKKTNAKRLFTPIVWAAMASQALLIGRSVYRVIEFNQGYFSTIATTEIYFYFFDTLLMICATAIYIPLFPPAWGLLGKKRLAMKMEAGSIEMSGQNGGMEDATLANA